MKTAHCELSMCIHVYVCIYVSVCVFMNITFVGIAPSNFSVAMKPGIIDDTTTKQEAMENSLM